ncbi:hypothetical protein D9757_000290 [Collybiopsis confluens]|uniref:Glutamyl-tRNA amidotransferase complex subunit Gta3 domain-containing protein n=1 Tax=Collybiopsis confluens TaxID=2823264 RepID=A0A8H5I278_9AGAR|nr:hypothetical protein D9757_000290 [Collybiopsis confluens]
MFRLPVRHRLPWRTTTISHYRTLKRSSKIDLSHDTDSEGLPVRPVWSVNELLSSYPKPELSSETFKHLHKLSALIPPDEHTPEFGELKKELEELVRLVEAVKLVDTAGVQPVDLRPTLGHREEAEVVDEDERAEDGETGRELLKYASRTSGEFYVVEADRKR